MKKASQLTLLTGLMCMTALAGCSYVPDYYRPEAPVPTAWYETKNNVKETSVETPQQKPHEKPANKPQATHKKTSDAATALTAAEKAEITNNTSVQLPDIEPMTAHIQWRDFFQSKDMQKVIDVALENNRDLRIAALNVEAARQAYNIERSDSVPNLNGDISGTRQNVPENASLAGAQASREYIYSQYSANLASTAFELDIFGRVRALNEAALEEFFASEQNRMAVQIALIAETANAYLQWLADREILQLSHDTLKAQEKSYNLINKSFENGIASKLEVAQIRQAVETAKTNIALYKRLVEQDKNALVLLMGTPDAAQMLKAVPLKSVSLMKKLPVGLPSEVLLLRPDVRQAEHLLKAKNANIGAARASFFPQIKLTGSYGFASSELSDLFAGGSAGAWSFAPSISVPIFNGGSLWANLRLSETDKEIAVAQYEKTVQTAFREVADELAARNTLSDQAASQRALVQASQDSYDLSYARYKKGIDNFLNVLDAQRSLFAAQQTAIELEKQRLTNVVNLYKTLGGGQI